MGQFFRGVRTPQQKGQPHCCLNINQFLTLSHEITSSPGLIKQGAINSSIRSLTALQVIPRHVPRGREAGKMTMSDVRGAGDLSSRSHGRE